MSNGNGRHSLTLDMAREKTPPVSPVEAMRRQLAVAVFGAVKETDVEQMVEKLKAMALEGDHKAMKMYFELIGVMGKQQAPPPPTQDGAGLRMMAEAISDLVDEVRLAKALDERKKISVARSSDDE